MFDVQQQKSSSPVLALASSSTSMDSDLIFSMSPDTPSPLHHHQPLPFRLSSQNRLLKRTSASSTIPMYYNGPGTLTRTRQRRVQDSHPDGSPLPALPKRLPSSSSCAAAATEASQKKNGGVKKNARGASGNGCDFMYSLPRSFTPHPLLKRAVPSPATIRPSVSTQTTQAHTPQKTMRQKEITPTSTRVSRSSTTPRPRTHSNVDVTSTTTISTTTNTRMYRQAYPSPPTSPSPSPSPARRRASGSLQSSVLDSDAGTEPLGETTPPSSSRALSLLSSSSLFASYYEKPQPYSSPDSSQSYSRPRSTSMSPSPMPIPIPHPTARRSVSDSYLYLTTTSSGSGSQPSEKKKQIRGRSSVRHARQPMAMMTLAAQPSRNELPSGFLSSEDELEQEHGGEQKVGDEESSPGGQRLYVDAPPSPSPSFHESGLREVRGRTWGRVGPVVRTSAPISSMPQAEMGLEYDISGLRSAFDHSDDDGTDDDDEEQAAVAWYSSERDNDHGDVEQDGDEDDNDDEDEHRGQGLDDGMPLSATFAEHRGCHAPHCHARHRSPRPMYMHMRDQLDFGLDDFDLEGVRGTNTGGGWARRVQQFTPDVRR